jgi:hypothetical protein|tara:strand:- start:17 stop:1063 length:1047 start_codon:yes stop_codon:yes gene_type:complete
MKIAVIGSGFYGATLSLLLSKDHDVDLFEKEKNIFNGASSSNQFRFHSGYHYPRSQKTVNEISKSKKDFVSFFGKKIFDKTINYYPIAKNGKINFKDYLKFLKKNKLPYKQVDFLKSVSAIENSILTNEKILNFFKTKKIFLSKIKNSNIKLFLKKEFKKEYLLKYDKVIIATYSNNNNVLFKLGIKKLNTYKYQLVEKIVIKLPKEYRKKSFVVIDGNFVCVDPYLGTNYHLLSDVKLSKLETIISKFPNFKSNKTKFLNKGIIRNIKFSKYQEFINRSSKYLPFLNKSKYIGSMFVVRALKKNNEKTDERTTSVYFHSKKILSIFSGKWNNCVYLAKNLKFYKNIK